MHFTNFTVLIFGALSSHCLSLHYRFCRRLLTIPNLTKKMFAKQSTKPNNFHAMVGNPQYNPTARNRNQSQRFQKFVPVTPPILAEKQRMQFDHFNKSDACEDVTCTVTTPLSKQTEASWTCGIAWFTFMGT